MVIALERAGICERLRIFRSLSLALLRLVARAHGSGCECLWACKLIPNFESLILIPKLLFLYLMYPDSWNPKACVENAKAWENR